MKKKVFLYLSVALAVFTAGSCLRQYKPESRAIPFVDNILADSSSARYSFIFSFNPENVKGSISIIGAPSDCARISEAFMTCDNFDNINGSRLSDGLPDFAGEIIASIIDVANTPYSDYIDSSNTDFLRELTVKEVLAALDTTTSISQFDHNGITTKLGAKVIILASKEMIKFGLFDVDTLFKAAGRKIPVIASTDSAKVVAEECFKLFRKNNLFTHDIAYPKATGFITVPSSSLSMDALNADGSFKDHYKYSRAADSDYDTFTIVEFSPRYMLDETFSSLEIIAPQTYKSYVQD